MFFQWHYNIYSCALGLTTSCLVSRYKYLTRWKREKAIICYYRQDFQANSSTPTCKDLATTNIKSCLSDNKELLGVRCFHKEMYSALHPLSFESQHTLWSCNKINNFWILMAWVYLRQRPSHRMKKEVINSSELER